ncbi:MAG: 50S ribosomal protein L21 [Patescibacteria group bacterium]|nr:50S ribosomal protein L21 [Patescibacteria group bacterium]
MSEIAVIKTGGKQYKVQAGDIVNIELLTSKKDEKIELPDILNGKKVQATILETTKADKVKTLKFKAKTRFIRHLGHRQKHTKIKIDKIV